MGAERLVFTQAMDFAELGNLLQQGYNKGSRPVEIAFEDVDLPELICRSATLHSNGGSSRLCLGGKVLDMLGDRHLPMGILKTRYIREFENRKPFSAYLVYVPVR
ncbi:MAG TPA: hypothetical protein VJJ52_07490 [Candidatus Nanoarchaeia archaeon]|nr:hypothetical protein [Candidatus Nanoarchaeia archaeon]